MKNYPEVKRCVNCKWSIPQKRSPWNLNCKHPLVCRKNPWYLSKDTSYEGADAHEERNKKWFGVCGMKGKLYENK